MRTKKLKLKMERTQHSLITEGVEEHEQTLTAGKPFWVFFVTNIGVAVWLLGVIIAGMGLNFVDAMFVILLGCLVSSVIPAVTALVGPHTRLSQMEAGRFSLGRTGKKLPAFLNWAGAIGWDVIGNVLSASALVLFLSGLGIVAPFWIALAILVGIQMMVGVYGHHVIQTTSQYTGALLGLLFIVIGIIAIHKMGGIPFSTGTASTKDIFSAFFLIFSYSTGSWATYTADYTRYMPKKTPSRTVFLGVFLGLFLSVFIMLFFGYVTASLVKEQTPQGVMVALQMLTGRFAPLVLFLIAFNSIPVNAVNDNSAAYCLMSSGFKLSRPASAILGAVVGYVICLLASDSFIDFFENFLFLFTHWVTPWAAIILVHWFVLGKKEQVTPLGITGGAIIFVVVSVASITLFSANSLFTGLLSDQVGGIDIGPYIGFIAAGALYYISLRLWPAKYKSVK